MSNIKFLLLAYCLIILISLIFLLPSFSLAFNVDELSNLVYKDYPYLKGIFRPYGVPLWFFNTLYDLLGSNPLPFFLISFFLRSITSLSIVIFIYQFTKNRLAAILSGLIFGLGFSGIQTTSEPVNMPIYLALACLIIFLSFFFLSRTKLSKANLFLMGLFLFLSTIISPIRINPIYIWALLVDFLWLIIYRSKENLRKLIIRQTIVLGILFFLTKMGSFTFGLSGQNAFLGSASDSINKIIISFVRGDFSIISNILIGFGNVIFPNEYNFIAKNFSPGFSLFLGIGFVFLLITAFFLAIKKRSENRLLLFSFLIWIPIFYLLPWIVSFTANGELVIFSFRRYLLPAFVGVAISLGYFLALAMKNKNIIIFKSLTLCIIILLLFHAFSILNFLNYLKTFEDGPYVEKIWQQIKITVPSLTGISEGKVSIFYFEVDSAKARYAADDAFSQRAAVIYHIPQNPYKINPNPHSIFSFEELVSLVKNGGHFMTHQEEPLEFFTWDRIFAFRVEGDRLIDIKGDVKMRVETVLGKNP